MRRGPVAARPSPPLFAWWRALATTSWLLLVVTACSPTSHLLVVDMRTDLAPGIEFDWVEVTLFRGLDADGEAARTVPDVAAGTLEDALSGARLAEFGDLAAGTWLVQVGLT